MKNFLLGGLLIYSLFVSVIYAQQNKKETTMENIQTTSKFHLIGISGRTTNQNQQALTDIETLWNQFWGNDIQKKIPNKTSDDIYAVYTDYESDFTGAYTTIIGLPVSSLDSIPKNMTGITIETASYKKFISKGKMPEAIMNTWTEIWQDKNLNRAYTADFTIHGEKYYKGENAEVETFISLKE